LFEQITQDGLDSLKQTISNQIELYFSNVMVDQLSITGNPNDNSISIILTYTLKNIQSSDSLVLKIQNG